MQLGRDVLLKDLARLRACTARLLADQLYVRVAIDRMFSSLARAELAGIHTVMVPPNSYDASSMRCNECRTGRCLLPNQHRHHPLWSAPKAWPKVGMDRPRKVPCGLWAIHEEDSLLLDCGIDNSKGALCLEGRREKDARCHERRAIAWL